MSELIHGRRKEEENSRENGCGRGFSVREGACAVLHWLVGSTMKIAGGRCEKPAPSATEEEDLTALCCPASSKWKLRQFRTDRLGRHTASVG